MAKEVLVPVDYYEKAIENNFFQSLWHRWRFRAVRRLLPSNALAWRVLDVGCHAGVFTEEIAKSLPGAKIWGIDVDSKVIEYARKKRPSFRFRTASVEALPFKDRHFDLVTCFEVLEHVGDLPKALAEISRCLKKNGQVMILVPSESLLFRLIWCFWLRGKGKVWQGAHLHNLGGSWLKELLAEKGFKIEKEEHSHLGMLKLVKARKLD